MKKKVKMICVLKSGAILEDTCKIDWEDATSFRAINEMRKALDKSIGYEEPVCSNITFGKLTVAVSEIAAIKFEEH